MESKEGSQSNSYKKEDDPGNLDREWLVTVRCFTDEQGKSKASNSSELTTN